MSASLSASTLLAVPLAPLVGSVIAGIFGYKQLPVAAIPLACQSPRRRRSN